jgi:hypothetical protein
MAWRFILILVASFFNQFYFLYKMTDMKIILIGSLFTATLIYSVLMSLMTFTTTHLSIFPTAYISSIKNKKSSKYYTTLLSNTISSYIITFSLFMLLLESFLELSKKTNIISSLRINSIIFFTLFVLILIGFISLLAIYANRDNFFVSKDKNNMDYNYPFFATLAYTIIFIILGSYYISIVDKNYQSKKNKNKAV